MTLDRRQLGLLMGVHRDTISSYVSQGMPVVSRGGRGRGDAAQFDAAACLAWYRERVATLNAKDAAMTRQFQATAELAELKVKRERLEVLPRNQVIQEWRQFTRGVAAVLGQLPERLRAAGVIRSKAQVTACTAVVEPMRTETLGASLAVLQRAEHRD
jgi:phage terminase Nu1 subunit (DNA packaging protein)